MEIDVTLQTLDWIVILAYGVALLGIGFWVSFRQRRAEDLFLASRSLRWPSIGLSIFGTNVDPSMLIAFCGTAYTTGMVIANFEWLAWLCMLLLAMLFVPHYLNTNSRTIPEFIRFRFGRSAYVFLSWYTLFTTIFVWLGTTLYASGILFSQIMDCSFLASILVVIVIATSFTVTGGLAAVVITDAFQSVLIIVGAATMTIISFVKIGSLQTLVDSVPVDYWILIRPVNDPEFPWPAMFLGYPVLGIWFFCADQTIVQRVLGAKDLRHGQLGVVFAAYLKILPPFLFMLTGIFCYVLHPNLANPDDAFLTMVTNYLPVGMVGLIIAVLAASLISTVDSALNSLSTVFTLDIYVSKFHPDASKEQITRVSRISTIGAAAIAVLCALFLKGVGKNLFDLIMTIISFVAPPISAVFVIGVLWKRATSSAAIWTLIAGSIVSLSVGVCHLQDWPNKQFWPHYMLLSFYLFVGICTLMVAVSRGTRKSSEEQALSTLREIYTSQNTQPRLVWCLWGVLAVIMLILYLIFN